MQTATYTARREELEVYFDRTAAEAWAKLTSDAPVSGIRATVRAGRDEMRNTLLSWLPEDLSGRRVLDAGCGAGQLAIEAARRGADVVAIDIAGSLVELARDRHLADGLAGQIDFRTGDMTDPALGHFDHIVAMDSLIHYGAADIVGILEGLLARTRKSALFTFAPRTPALTVMHTVGKLFPRSDRAPAIQPVGDMALRSRMQDRLGQDTPGRGWRPARAHRVKSGFYISQAMEVVPA